MAKKPLVMITGASSGIGKATALAFAGAGYPLLLLARRVELL
jgi:NADP-dependent 3-hydroxy acid dehydrogenase YdfG